MSVEPFGAFAPLPVFSTSTVEVLTPNGASTVITGFSPTPPVTVTASNLSVDAPAGATANGVAHMAMSAVRTRRRRTRETLHRTGGAHNGTGGFDPPRPRGTPPRPRNAGVS